MKKISVNRDDLIQLINTVKPKTKNRRVLAHAKIGLYIEGRKLMYAPIRDIYFTMLEPSESKFEFVFNYHSFMNAIKTMKGSTNLEIEIHHNHLVINGKLKLFNIVVLPAVNEDTK